MNNWGRVLIILHWLTAILVVGLFSLGLWMVDLDYGHEWYHKAPFIHESVGMFLFFLMIFRLVWRVKYSAPKPLVTHSKREIFLAKSMYMSLYILIFATISAGYMAATDGGKAISVFNLFKIPALPFGFDHQVDIAGEIHLILASIIIIMACLHALAAFKHHFIDKDNTLRRML